MDFAALLLRGAGDDPNPTYFPPWEGGRWSGLLAFSSCFFAKYASFSRADASSWLIVYSFPARFTAGVEAERVMGLLGPLWAISPQLSPQSSSKFDLDRVADRVPLVMRLGFEPPVGEGLGTLEGGGGV